jgi:hypothetical protein
MRCVTALVRSPWYSAPFLSTVSWMYRRCSAAPRQHCSQSRDAVHTTIEASKTNLQAQECWDSMFCL